MVPNPFGAAVLASLFWLSGSARAQTPEASPKPATPAQPATAAVAADPSGGTSGSLDKSGTGDNKSGTGDKTKKDKKPALEVATFGGGCFWHVEAVFDRMKGVKTAVSGYAGGTVAFPNYELVHTGQTGHIEVVQVVYDPAIVTYEDLLKAFWANHDPTSIDRQGPDEGTQYRSAIFYHNEDQRKAALKSYQELTDARAYARPIVTVLLPMRAFYKAEDYHQDYYGGKPRASSRTRAAAKTKRPAPSTAARKALAKKSSSPTPATPRSSSTRPVPSTSPVRDDSHASAASRAEP